MDSYFLLFRRLIQQDDIKLPVTVRQDSIDIDVIDRGRRAMQPRPCRLPVDLAGRVTVETRIEPDIAILPGRGKHNVTVRTGFGIGEEVVDQVRGKGRDVVVIERCYVGTLVGIVRLLLR